MAGAGSVGSVDERTWDVMLSVQRFMDEALDAVRAGAQASGPLLGELVEGHVEVDPSTVPVVRLDVLAP